MPVCRALCAELLKMSQGFVAPALSSRRGCGGGNATFCQCDLLRFYDDVFCRAEPRRVQYATVCASTTPTGVEAPEATVHVERFAREVETGV